MLTFFAIALATVAFATAFHFWQRSRNISALLMEGAKGYEELRHKNNRLEKAILSFENQLAELRRSDDQSRRNLTHVSSNAAKVEQEHIERTRDLERKLRNVELQRDHILNAHDALQTKYDTATLKIDELTSASETWTKERRDLKKNLDDVGAQTIVKLKAELNQERQRNQDLNAELKQLKSRDVINPKDFDALRRRASHYERLYAGMKGLRDMVDERNKNWEDALEKLARWVLTSSSVAQPNDPILASGIGPVVGEALERIGLTLLEVDDQRPDSEHEAKLPDIEFRAGAKSEFTESLS